MTSNDRAAERAASTIPDLRELAERIEIVLDHPWIDRGTFLRDTMDGLTQAVQVLPAGPGRVQLADLAARIGRVLADPEADRQACLRDTRDALAPLAELTAADLCAAADRAAWVAGLRDLADYLAGHPDAPVPGAHHTQTIHVFPDGETDDERRAGVDAAATVIGATASDPGGVGHYQASRAFGPVVYEVLAISDASRAARRARDSYYSSVTVDEASADAGLGQVA